MEEKSHKDYGISDETLDEMIQFFLKTSIPRIMEERHKEDERSGEEWKEIN